MHSETGWRRPCHYLVIYPGAQSSNLLNGTMWILFQFRLISGDTATHHVGSDHMGLMWFGRKTDINTIHTHDFFYQWGICQENRRHSVYSKYEGIQGRKSEVCMMLEGREPPLMSWFSRAHPEATGKLPWATSACSLDVGAPQEAHLGAASSLTSAHLSAAVPLENNGSVSLPQITCPPSALLANSNPEPSWEGDSGKWQPQPSFHTERVTVMLSWLQATPYNR